MICIIEMNKISNSSNEMRDLKSLEKKKQKHLSMTQNSETVKVKILYIPVQFSSATQSCLTLCDPMDCNMPDLPVHHQLPERSIVKCNKIILKF